MVNAWLVFGLTGLYRRKQLFTFKLITMEKSDLTIIDCFYGMHQGKTKDQNVLSLYKYACKDSTRPGEIYQLYKPIYLKSWYWLEDKDAPTMQEIETEMVLNDWSRWNTDLTPGDPVEVSETVYWDCLGAVPPKTRQGNYFEVGEPHHHDNKGRAIHRAFWMQDDKYFTGYPKTIKQTETV